MVRVYSMRDSIGPACRSKAMARISPHLLQALCALFTLLYLRSTAAQTFSGYVSPCTPQRLLNCATL